MKKLVVLSLVIFALTNSTVLAQGDDGAKTVCGMIQKMEKSMKTLEQTVADHVKKVDLRLEKIEQDVSKLQREVDGVKKTVGSFEAEDCTIDRALELQREFNTPPYQDQVNALKSGVTVEELKAGNVMVIKMKKSTLGGSEAGGTYMYNKDWIYVTGISLGKAWLQNGTAIQLKTVKEVD